MPIETLVFAFDALSRRWRLFLLPLLIAAPLALYFAMTTSLRYTAKSVIMLQAANRGVEVGGVMPRASALEQVSAIEAWLKSDEVLGSLLPKLVDGPLPQTLQGQLRELARLRRTLKIEFVGSSVLEMTLEGSNAKGLGRRLELIVSRMMEGLLNPEAGILSAPQLVLLRRSESFTEAEHDLHQLIISSGVGAVEPAMRRLKEIYDLQREAILRGGGARPGEAIPTAPSARPLQLAEQIEEKRRALAPEMRLVTRLELLFASYEEARQAFEIAKRSVGARADTYVRVFDSPERLTIVGRPRDPLEGQNPAIRFGLAGMLLATLLGAGLVVLSEWLDPRLRTRRDFEAFTGVPLVTRVPVLQAGDLQRV